MKPKRATPRPTTAADKRASRSAPSQCSGTGWQQRRGAAALARINYPYRSTGFRIRFLPAHGSFYGYTTFAARRIDIYVRACSVESTGFLTHVIAHEIGHAVDYVSGTSSKRARWLQLRGIPAGTPWYGGAQAADFATPAGDFAEVFSYLHGGDAIFRSQLAPAPGPAQARLLRSFF